MLKKVAKALDEMAKNEELMEGILAAAVGDIVSVHFLAYAHANLSVLDRWG